MEGRIVTFVLSRNPTKKKSETMAGFLAILDDYIFNYDHSYMTAEDVLTHYWHCQSCNLRIITYDEGLVLPKKKPEKLTNHNHDLPKRTVVFIIKPPCSCFRSRPTL